MEKNSALTIQTSAAGPAAVKFGEVELWLGRPLEALAALLVVAETIMVFAGVVSRYVFHTPIIWGDELASVLLVWLVMVGVSLAHLRHQQMRVTVITELLPPSWRQDVETLATLITAAFLVIVLLPAYEYFEGQIPVQLQHLQVSDGPRVFSLVFGVATMFVISLLHLFRSATLRGIIVGLGVMACVVLALWFAKPVLVAMGNLNLTIFFVLLLAICIAAGVPIAFSFGIATVLYLIFMTRMPLSIVVSRMDEGVSHLILLAIPLFVFLGFLIEMTGIAGALVRCMVVLLGHVRGGLSYAIVGAMYLVSGISGSKTADMAAIAPGLLPEMKRRGSNANELTALFAATGAQTETIPPSFVLICVGAATSVSITALFTGGMLPAAICGAALVVVTFLRTRGENHSGVARASLREVASVLIAAAPALALPVLIRVAVAEGVATATEVATVGVVYALIVGPLIYRQFDARRVYPILVKTASLSGAIMIILGLASAMAWALTQSGFSGKLVLAITSMPGGATGFLAVSIVAFILMGSVLEGLPAILVFAPLLFPAARLLGIHEVHYAMVVIIAMGLGLFAPPFGVGYYAACAVSGVHPNDVMKRIWPYLGAVFIGLLLIAAVPWLSIGFL